VKASKSAAWFVWPVRSSAGTIGPPSGSDPLVNGPAVTFSSERLYVPASLSPASSTTIVQVPVTSSWNSARSFIDATASVPFGRFRRIRVLAEPLVVTAAISTRWPDVPSNVQISA